MSGHDGRRERSTVSVKANIDIMAVGPEAAEDLARIHARAFAGQGRGWSAAEFARLLALPGHVAVLARTRGETGAPDSGRPLGFVLYAGLGDDGEILTIAVDPDWQRQGLGGRLLSMALADLAMNGCRRVLLEVAADNEAAIALYRAAGFEDVGRRPCYYARPDGGRVDARLMALHFSGGCGCDD